MTEIRVLAVRQPWASLIVEGLKTIEVRSKPTNIRERVAIYASRNYNREDFLKLRENPNYIMRSWDFGKILGTVEIVASSGCNDEVEYALNKREHSAPDEYFNEGKTYFWHLRRPVKFETPIPYKPPKGAVVWSKTELPEGY